MATKTLLSLATVSLLAFAANADDPTPSYTVETTNSWFSVDASEDDLTTNWSGATRTSENNLIKVDTEAGSPAIYTPTENLPNASRYRVTGKMTVTLNAGEPAPFTGNDLPKAALVAASVGGDNKWYAWHLTGQSAGAWVAMNNGATPDDGEEYDITIEFTSSGITYYVEGTALTHGEPPSTTTVLSNAGGMSLSKVGLAGYGSFGDFGALGFDSFTVEATISSAVKTAMGIEGEIDSAALNKVGANGLTKWESIVLGLPNQSTKPYTAPVQTNNGKLGFTIGAAEIGKYNASGADVTVEVLESSTPGEGFTPVSEQRQTAGDSENNYTATVTPDSSGVKYYKIKIKFQ